MSLYLEMGTVASPNHHLEVSGPTYFEAIENSASSQIVPFEIHSNYSTVMSSSYLSRQIRCRITTSAGIIRHTDIGVNQFGDYFFISEPTSSTTSSSHDSSVFTINTNKNIGFGCTDATSRLEIRDNDSITLGNPTATDDRQWSLQTNAKTPGDFCIGASTDSSTSDIDFTLNNPYLTISKEGYFSLGTSPYGTTSRLYVEGELNVEGTAFLYTAATAMANKRFDILPSNVTQTDFAIGSSGSLGLAQIYADTFEIPGHHTFSESSINLMASPTLPWNFQMGSSTNLFGISGIANSTTVTSGGFGSALNFSNFSTTNFMSDTLFNINGSYNFFTNSNLANFFIDTAYSGWNLNFGKSGERVQFLYAGTNFSIAPAQAGSIGVGSATTSSVNAWLDSSGYFNIYHNSLKTHEWQSAAAGFFLTNSNWNLAFGLGNFTIARSGAETTLTETGNLKLDAPVVRCTGDLRVDSKFGIGISPTAVLDVINSTVGSSSINIRRNTTDHMILDTNGNLSLGSSTASASLHVQKTNASGDVVKFLSTALIPLVFSDSGLLGVGVTTPLAVGHFSSTGSEDSIRVEKSGTVQAILTAAGKVGFNVSPPVAALDLLNPDSSNPVFRATTTLGESLMYTNDNLMGIGTSTPDSHLTVVGPTGTENSLRIERNSLDHLILDSAGALGLNKTPSARFDLLNYESTAVDSIHVTRRAGYSGSTTTTHAKLDSSGNFGLGNSNPVASIDVKNLTSSQPVALFNTTTSIPMTFTNSGYLGVGTASPVAALNVVTSGTEDSLKFVKSGFAHLWLNDIGSLGVGTQSSPAASVDVKNLTPGQPVCRLEDSNGSFSILTDSSDLGLGTQTPNASVHVLKTANPSSLRLEVTGATQKSEGHSFFEAISSNLGESAVMFKDDVNQSSAFWSWASEWDSSKIHLRRDTANFTGIPWITADSNGGVGIHEVNPSAALSITSPGLATSLNIDNSFLVQSDGKVSVNSSPANVMFNVLGDSEFDGNLEISVGNSLKSVGAPFLELIAGSGLDPCDRVRLSVPGSTGTNPFISIETDGTVGIGSVSPAAKLDIQNPDQTLSLLVNDSVSIDQTGQIGIGTTSPSSQIHIALEKDSTPGTSGILAFPTSIRADAQSRDPIIQMIRGDEADLDAAVIQRPQSEYGIEIGLDGVDSYLDFNKIPGKSKKFDLRSTGTTNVSFLSDGSVGIGTQNPNAMLEIEDTVLQRDALVISDTVFNHLGKLGIGGAPSSSLRVAATSNGDGLRIDGSLGFDPRLTLESVAGNEATIEHVNVSGDHRENCMEIVNDTGRLNVVVDSSANAPAMTVTPNGFSGINTKFPQNRLHIADESVTLVRISASRTNDPWVWDFDLDANGNHDGTYTLNTQGDSTFSGIIFTDDSGTAGLTDYGSISFKAGETGQPEEARFVLCVGGESSNAIAISADRDDTAANASAKRYIGMETVAELIPTIDPFTGNLTTSGEFGVTRTIFRNGRVAIGMDDPQYPLHVMGYGYLGATDLAYWVHEPTTKAIDANNPGVTLDLPTTSNFIGIHSEYSISTDMAILALSDRRVKYDIAELDDGEALGLLRNLKPSRFKRRDIRGEDPEKFYYGLIAQEVKEILPHAVTSDQSREDCVFDFKRYVGHEIIGNRTFRLTLHDEWDISESERVKLVFDLGGGRASAFSAVVEERDDHILIVKLDKGFSSDSQIEGVFVLGRLVSDLQRVDYNVVNNLTLAAVQELDRENNKLHKKIRDLEVALGEILKKIGTA